METTSRTKNARTPTKPAKTKIEGTVRVSARSGNLDKVATSLGFTTVETVGGSDTLLKHNALPSESHKFNKAVEDLRKAFGRSTVEVCGPPRYV